MHGTHSPATLLKSIAINQARHVRNLLTSKTVQPPSLVSATLDLDDVEIARQYLDQPETWAAHDTTTAFEQAFADWNGSKKAFAFMGGRVALSAAIYALALKPGDEVIIPGFTCIVVPNAFLYQQINPVYADIELDTYGPDIESVRACISPNTKAILIHHLFGLVCRDYEAILDLAKKHKLRVIEDCAHATGAIYKGHKVGNYGDIAFYSCEASKVFNTIQGGIATTNTEIIAERLETYYNQASLPSEHWTRHLLYNVLIHYYRFKHQQRWAVGDLYRLRYAGKELISTSKEEEASIKPAHYGKRMPSPVAALGLNQMGKLDMYCKKRQKTANLWAKWCDDTGYKQPVAIPESEPGWLRYPVMVEPAKKCNLKWALQELGVLPGVWFIGHLHPTRRHVANCPNASKAVASCINMPTLLDEQHPLAS